MRNAHDIALCIEGHLRSQFNIIDRPSGTIFDANSIESYAFYDMINLLLVLFGHGNYSDFLNDIYQYKNINMNKIDNYEEIYNNFLSFYL